MQSQSVWTFLIIIGAFLAVAAWLGHRNSIREKKNLQEHFREVFGKPPSKTMSLEQYQRVPAFFQHHRTDHAIDDITWNDLDMDRIFHRIDSTQSAAGEEYLYYVLRTPSLHADQLPVRRECMEWLGHDTNINTRLTLQQLLFNLGSTGKISLLDYLDQLDSLGKMTNTRHYIAIILPLVSIGIMFFTVPVGMVLLVASLIANMLTYLEQRRTIEPYMVSFRYLLRLLKVDTAISAVNVGTCRPLQEDQERLASLLKEFETFRRGSFMLMSGSGTGNPLDIIMDYVRMLFHLDLIKFNQMLQQVQNKRAQIDTLLMITGRIDTEIAAASFRKSLPYYCEPVMLQGTLEADTAVRDDVHGNAGQCAAASDVTGCRAQILVDELFHPLLLNPVPNSIHAVRPVLLTGSNASGKSTFLKAVALASLLAQTLDTVCAKQYRAPFFRIYSSMALRDNMQAGDSYFMVEIKSLKRIMDAAMAAGPAAAGTAIETGDTAAPVLCFIDEVLRGTNTIERIAASSEILETFASAGTLAFAATHDIELSDLLKDSFDNYHFEETLTRDPSSGKEDVRFSYQLLPGKAHTRNAIRLLSAIGFDQKVTRKAQERAEVFERTGKWV